jgi:hypothetical protein
MANRPSPASQSARITSALPQLNGAGQNASGSSKLKALSRELQLTVEHVPHTSLRAYKRSLRTHTPQHIEQLKASIQAFGLVQPILVSRDGEIIAGHGLFEAARQAGHHTVPIIRVAHLDEPEIRALRIALNRLAETSGWNTKLLALELEELVVIDRTLDPSFDLSITGFASPEIDQLIETHRAKEAEAEAALPEPSPGAPVARLGDFWLWGKPA